MLIVDKLKAISKIKLLAVVLIGIGLLFTIRYSIGTFRAYRAFEYAQANDFEAGNVDPDLIRPWMNIRYIAVVFAVPQEFLFAELGIPMERRNNNVRLNQLNDQFFEQETRDGQLIIVDKLQDAIIKYRENPITTGLRERGVRPWMSVQYISNSTGIPPETIFEQIGVPMEGNAFIPLERLSAEVRYRGGPRALVEDIQQIVDTYEASP